MVLYQSCNCFNRLSRGDCLQEIYDQLGLVPLNMDAHVFQTHGHARFKLLGTESALFNMRSRSEIASVHTQHRSKHVSIRIHYTRRPRL